MSIVFSVADASLLFSGALSPHLSIAVGMILLSSGIIAGVLSILSGLKGAIAGSQGALIVILVTIIDGVLISLPTGVGERALLATIVATVAFTTLVLGVSYWLAGQFKLGRFIRYLPYAVVAGFLAGAGFLLLQFSFTLTTGTPLAQLTFDFWRQPESHIKFFLGIGVAAALAYLSRAGVWRFAMPLSLLGCIALFLIVIDLIDLPFDYWLQHDWMLAQERQPTLYPPIRLDDITLIDWRAVLSQFPQILALVVVALIATLIKISSLEVMLQTEVDQDRELQSLGVANMFCGFAGLTPGFQTLSLTHMAKNMHAEYRLAGLFVCIFCLAAVFFSGDMLIYTPRFVFGGLVMWVGGSLLYTSLAIPYRMMNKLEFSIIVLILFTIIIFGFLPGMVIGFATSIVLFVHDYSHISVIRQEYDGVNFRSNVDRPITHRDLLQQRGKEVLILRLHGYLFFGTTYRFIEQLKFRLNKKSAKFIKYIILDFEKVTGMDSSAKLTLSRLKYLANWHNFSLIVSGVSPEIVGVFSLNEKAVNAENCCRTRIFTCLDKALEWTEEQQLKYHSDPTQPARQIEPEGFLDHYFTGKKIDALSDYLESVNLNPQEVLLPFNTRNDSIYFVRSGTLDIQVPTTDRESVRIRKIGPGAVIGEVSMYLKRPSSATAIARENCKLWRLTRDNLNIMLRDNPQLASSFHNHMATILASRLADNSRLIQVLANS